MRQGLVQLLRCLRLAVQILMHFGLQEKQAFSIIHSNYSSVERISGRLFVDQTGRLNVLILCALVRSAVFCCICIVKFFDLISCPLYFVTHLNQSLALVRKYEREAEPKAREHERRSKSSFHQQRSLHNNYRLEADKTHN